MRLRHLPVLRVGQEELDRVGTGVDGLGQRVGVVMPSADMDS
jgi:hypothetical protein